MSDIVEHLRREASKQDMLACEDMLRAADEIERLRAALKRIVDEADSDAGLTIWDGGDIARRALEQKADTE